MYRIGQLIHVNDRMQKNYQYKLSAGIGEDFATNFNPHFSPKKMLALGIFEGKYCNDCIDEYPDSWFRNAKLSSVPNVKVNHFGVQSRQPLSIWVKKGWIIGPDPRGWFQWYCRYFLGRRLAAVDNLQIKRWRSFSRHTGQIKKNCEPGNIFCRPRQRQALLQWSHNPYV